jgi:hypothetical protein
VFGEGRNADRRMLPSTVYPQFKNRYHDHEIAACTGSWNPLSTAEERLGPLGQR